MHPSAPFQPASPDAAPCPRPFNLAAHVLRRAALHPDRTALGIVGEYGIEAWSYGRLEAAVRGVATGLLSLGLTPGDRIMLRLGSGPAFPLAFLGAVTAGLVPAPTPAGLTGPEVTRLAAAIGPRLIVAGPGLALPDAAPCPLLAEVDLLGFEGLAPADWDLGDPDRLGYIIFTSGSSGRPRAVAHAHRAVWARRMMDAGWTGIGADDVVLHAGALNWTYTLGTGLFDPWAAGATALVPSAAIDTVALPQLIRDHDVTIFAAVPGVYRKLLKSGADLGARRLRHGLSAGEKLAPTLRLGWRAATGTDLHEALGMTECSTFISSSPGRPAPDGAAGFAQPGRRIAVLDDDGAACPFGSPGILAVHRDDPGLFLGYVEEEGIVPPKGNWFLTGDVVAMAEDGSVTTHGRNDDMLNAGGFRVSPAEVESALGSVPGVTACAAVDLKIGAETTVIALFYCGDADEEALRAGAARLLAPYKHPRIHIRLDRLPTNANGKTDRRVLREERSLTP